MTIFNIEQLYKNRSLLLKVYLSAITSFVKTTTNRWSWGLSRIGIHNFVWKQVYTFDFFHIIIIFNALATFILLPIECSLSMVVKDVNPQAYEHEYDHEQH
jgi:hypothetical protein